MRVCRSVVSPTMIHRIATWSPRKVVVFCVGYVVFAVGAPLLIVILLLLLWEIFAPGGVWAVTFSSTAWPVAVSVAALVVLGPPALLASVWSWRRRRA